MAYLRMGQGLTGDSSTYSKGKDITTCPIPEPNPEPASAEAEGGNFVTAAILTTSFLSSPLLTSSHHRPPQRFALVIAVYFSAHNCQNHETPSPAKEYHTSHPGDIDHAVLCCEVFEASARSYLVSYTSCLAACPFMFHQMEYLVYHVLHIGVGYEI